MAPASRGEVCQIALLAQRRFASPPILPENRRANQHIAGRLSQIYRGLRRFVGQEGLTSTPFACAGVHLM
jgi:hypothetical protein